MQNTTADYKLEINKPSRQFECKITIGNNIYTNEDLVNLTLEYTQPQEGFAIGNTISKSLDLTLLNRGDIIYSTSQIKIEIGLRIGPTIEYILMGIFNIDDIEKTDYTTKFTAYDNMIKFETAYFSSLGDKPTLKQVVNELSKITGVEFTGSLPAYTVKKLDSFSCREVLSYVASICGGNAVITRDGKFTIKTLGEVEKSIDGNNYFNYTREEVKYKVGKISCQVDENNILSKGSIGTDSMELGFENQWVTETIITEIYNKLNGLSYLGYSMKWQGDLSLDPYDIITVTDVKNVVRKIPILSQKITYTGGLTSEIGAKGETKNKNSFSSSGSTTNKVNRAVIEQAIIKEALIEKANIKDVEAVSIRTQTLEAKTAKIEEIISDVAHIKDLNAINANIEKLIAADATINNALIGKADITELNAVKGTINVLESDTANIKNLLAGNITGESGQLIHLTASNVVIADAVIKDLIASNISVQDLKTSTISTNKFSIASTDGGLSIVGPTMQFKDKNNKVRIQMGQDTQGNFNFILRGADGTTTLIDHTGIKEKAIADDLIKSNMVAADAIGEKQINYSSLITGLNKDTNTSLIKASKVAIDLTGQSLEVAFNSLKSNVDNIQVGGRNLILNSKTILLNGSDNGNKNCSIIENDYVKISPINNGNVYNTEVSTCISRIQGKTYTLTFEILTPTPIGFYWYPSESYQKFNYINASSKWQRISFTYTQTAIDKNTKTLFGLNGLVGGNIYYYRNLKLEEGNKPTDWTPAIEDIDTKIESNTTAITVAQGKIDALISENTIIKGDITTISNKYTSLKATVDGINTTVASHTSSIGTINTNISGLSGKVTIVENNYASLSQNLEGFKTTVGNTYSTKNELSAIDGKVISLDSRVNTAESSITQLNNKIDLKVEATDITNAINSLEIGGRNLMPQSNREWGSSNEYIGVTITDIVKKYVGKTMTISCDIKANKNGKIHFYSLGGYGVGFNIQYQVTTDWTRIKATGVFTFHDKENPWCNLSVYGIYGTGLISLIRNIKIEIGNKATDYTKAPEDVDLSISNIDGKVDGVQLEVNTTKNQVAVIEANLNSITQRVSSTESTTAVISSNLGVTTNIANNALNTANSANNKVDSVQIEVTTTKNQVASIETNLNSIAQRVSNTESLSAKIEDINYLTKVAGVELLPQLYRTGNNNGYFANGGWLGNYLNDRIHIQGQTWVTTDFIKFDRSKPLYFKFNYYNENGMLYVGIERYRQDKSVIENAVNGACYYLFTRDTNTNGYENYEGYFNESSSETAYIKLRILSNWDNRPGFSQSLFPEISFRQLQGNIQDNIIYHEQRIQSAEQKITPTAITTTISEVITGGTGSISTTQFVMDKNGLTIKNGALTIKNKSGTTVLNSDTNGNLVITGEMRSQYGQQWVGLNAGGLTFQDWNRNEQMLRVGLSYFESNRDMNGVNFALAKYGDFIRFSHIEKTDLTNGWSSSDTQYNFFDCWSSEQTVDGATRKKGVNMYAPAYINNGLFFNNTSSTTSDIVGNFTWNNGTGNTTGLLGMCGDNGLFLGYKDGEDYKARMILTETSHPGTGDNIISWGNYNFNGYTFHNASIAANYLTVSGSKNCLQKTKNYGSRLINAYETAEYYFGDLGFGKINTDGECLAYIDDIFLECVNTNAQYHVFTQIYNGKITSIERYTTYVVIKGEPGTDFSWQLMGKRIEYENNRLDTQDIETQGENKIELFGYEDFKVETSEDTLMNVLTFELEDLLLMEG